MFLNQFHQFWVFFASKHWPISTHKFWWSICQNPISCAEVMDEKVILYRFSRKHFVQCDMKNVFASYSKFVSENASQMFSSILGWGKLLISKFLMMYNVSIKATSQSTVSNRPISYSVTFWGSNEEVELYKKWLKIEVLQMIFHNLKSILTSRNLAAGYNLTSSPSYKDFKKCASINVTLYGFGIIQGFSAKKLFLWPNQLYLSGFM